MNKKMESLTSYIESMGFPKAMVKMLGRQKGCSSDQFSNDEGFNDMNQGQGQGQEQEEACRMKSVVEASRKEALRQEAVGIAPPEDDSGESSPEDTPKEEHNEGIPEYTPQETRGAGEEADLAGDMQNLGEPPANEAATQTDSVARSRLKGKEKVGEPSEPVALSHGTPSPRSVVNEPNDAPRDAEAAREPLGAVAPKFQSLLSQSLSLRPRVVVLS
ncbi:hypothetical protein LWI29_030711 [Acer saccharum]|uniref:Uncharacterized protein n=1 Tax=Acer saccharum TaxID=4024 RepID=A0AA39SZN8_ACESA|nr:hypothetical protein LWI29_030711 [Acer saccharum]